MALVNIGCGSVFHPTWVNLDAHPVNSAVRRWDVRKGLPFQDKEMDACYTAHLLEHLTREASARFLEECWRVLRPEGIIRVVVPDLEAIARHYLRLLDQADSSDPGAEADYDWMLLELFDQMVRIESGGEIHRYLTSGNVSNAAFVVSRIGLDAEGLISRDAGGTSTRGDVTHYWKRLREEIVASTASVLLGREARYAVKEGLFRHSGQLHLWMYDRFSLRRLLEDSGFAEARRCEAHESRIPGFSDYDLDTLDGCVRKPDSLFMEAVKP